MIASLVAAVVASSLAAGPLVNGNFEQGVSPWLLANTWYQQPKGAGTSAITLAKGEGRDGSTALKIVGGGKRGLAMQVMPAYPGKYRISGWIKCEGLTGAKAQILAEWLAKGDKWLKGDSVGTVTGTQGWTHVEATIEPPPTTRIVHLDLLTSSPNKGTAWFDDIEFVRLKTGLPAPAAPVISAQTPSGEDACLQVSWDPAKLSKGVIRLLVYCEEKPIADVKAALPRAILDPEDGKGFVRSLVNGKRYYLAAVAVNGDGEASPLGASVEATPADREAPRPGWIWAEKTPGGAVAVSWSPHVLDFDVKTVHIVAPGAGKTTRELKSIDVGKLYAEPRPFFCTEPWVTADVDLGGASKVGVWCEDRAGNRGEVGWDKVMPAAGTGRAPCALWLTPPTKQVMETAAAPDGPGRKIALNLMRGQARSFQVMLRPTSTMHNARVRFDPLVSADGRSRIATRWLAYHFVNYVHLQKDAIDTPPDEQCWHAPADYPDELSDDTSRDLPADQVQPVFIRIMAPRDAAPGVYHGRGTIVSDEGTAPFEYTATVSPVVLPATFKLKFIYWYGLPQVCKQFGVDPASEDGWRALTRIAQMMHAYGENGVVVAYSLVHTWRLPNGKLANDFRDFDRYVKTFQDAGVDSIFAISHMGGRSTGAWECPTMSPHKQTVHDLATGAVGQVDAPDIIGAIQDHVQAMGLLNKFAVHIADEPIPQNVASYRQLSALVHKAAPKLRRIDAIHVPDLSGSLEIWVPQLNYFEQWLPQYRKAQRAGNELWFYIAWVPQGHFPNRMIDSFPIKVRILHWLNAIYDTSGYLHWALNWWNISLQSLNSPGDQYITWPSKRFIANSSLRYEAEREGLEDCELMFMVRDAMQKQGVSHAKAQQHIVDLTKGVVPGIEKYTRSWSALEQVRKEFLDEATAQEK